MSAFLSTIIVQCISVQFVITFKWDFVGKSTHTDDHTEAGGKAGDRSIQQILLDEGELMTVGSDGFIRVSLYINSMN